MKDHFGIIEQNLLFIIQIYAAVRMWQLLNARGTFTNIENFMKKSDPAPDIRTGGEVY